MKPSVLMTDPRHFAIKGGANPHTRRADNSLKQVDIGRAWPQWHAYVDALLAGGVDVYVAEAGPELTGMVFAANAGFLEGRLDDRRPAQKTFYPSHFTAVHRRDESARFARFMDRFGMTVADYPDDWRFEGEADGFSVGRGSGRRWLFTWGFRSDEPVGDWLEDEVVDQPVIRLKLADPRFYHGDCLLCDLGGPFLGWMDGLAEASAARLRDELGHRLIELTRAQADDFVGNSFYVESDQGRLLYTPVDIDEDIRGRIESQGVHCIPVDISEFFGKGGGGPKCLVFNLGQVDPDDPRLTDDQRDFRRARHVQTLRQNGAFPVAPNH